MKNYVEQIEALGLHANDKSAEQNTPFIVGGVARRQVGGFTVYEESFVIRQTAQSKKWELGCADGSGQGMTFDCASFDEALEKLSETYRSLGFIKDNQRAA